MPAYNGTDGGNFIFNRAKMNHLQLSINASYWNWHDDDTDGTGDLYCRLVVYDSATGQLSAAEAEALLKKDNVSTFATLLSYEAKLLEYSTVGGTLYPANGFHPSIPAMGVAAEDVTNDEADIPTAGNVTWSSLGADTDPAGFGANTLIRAMVVCHQDGGAQADDDPVIAWIETGGVEDNMGTGSNFVVTWPTGWSSFGDL